MKLLNVCANYSNSTSSFMFTNPDTRIQKLIPDDVVTAAYFQRIKPAQQILQYNSSSTNHQHHKNDKILFE